MTIKVRKRHTIWQKIARPFVSCLLKGKFNYKCEPCNIKPPFIVIGNHTTDYDAFFMMKSFSCPIYFVMSDHISSLKVGKLIEHLVCPIPITKSTSDAETVRGIMRVIKGGAAVGLFPEGNKSFAGDMSFIKPSTAKLFKKLNVPVVIYNIKGGYFSSPRWTHVKRKRHVHGAVKKILMPEELEKMSVEEIYDVVKENLRVNAYEVQEQEHVKFSGKNLAKNIETLLYMCPKCRAFSTLHGEGNNITCSNCDFHATYDEYGYVHGHSLISLDQMDKWQKEQLLNMDFDSFSSKVPITSDEGFEVFLKIDKFKSQPLGVFRLDLYKNEFELFSQKQTITIPLSEVSGYGIEGVNGIQLSLKDGRVYRMKNPNPVSGLKYVNLYAAIEKKPMKF